MGRSRRLERLRVGRIVLARQLDACAKRFAPHWASGFDLGGAHNLTFQYHDFVSDAIVTGTVTYPIVAGVQGDYNNNGTVDAADYILWRKTLGSTTDLRANGDNTGNSENVIDAADYAFWRGRFGNPAGSGAFESGAQPVPEPTSILLCIIGAVLWKWLWSRRHPLDLMRMSNTWLVQCSCQPTGPPNAALADLSNRIREVAGD